MTEPATRLDDLFGYDDGADPGTLPVTRQTAWLKAALISAGAAGAIYAVLRMVGFRVPYLLLFAVALALVLVRRAVQRVQARPVPRMFTDRAPRIATETVRGTHYRTDAAPVDQAGQWSGRWTTQLTWSEKDPAKFSRMVLPRLATIVDERLRFRHGITRASDPVRARALLDDRLWALLHEPVTRSPNPRELASVIAALEKL